VLGGRWREKLNLQYPCVLHFIDAGAHDPLAQALPQVPQLRASRLCLPVCLPASTSALYVCVLCLCSPGKPPWLVNY
jgi:hypothetical protein